MRSIVTLLFALLLVGPSLAPAFADAPAPPPVAKDKDKAKPKKAELLDINTATPDQLKALPGVTDEVAGKIVAGRPYKGKDALLKQKIVDKDGYAKIRELIIAKQPKKAETTGAAPHAASPKPAPAPSHRSSDKSDDAILGGGAPGAAPPAGPH